MVSGVNPLRLAVLDASPFCCAKGGGMRFHAGTGTLGFGLAKFIDGAYLTGARFEPGWPGVL